MLKLPNLLTVCRLIGPCLLLGSIAACGGSKSELPGLMESPLTQNSPIAAEAYSQSGFSPALPVDFQRPWEKLDSAGNVLPLRQYSSIDASTEFAAGAQTDSTFGTVAVAGQASSLTSGSKGGKQASFALYRLSLGGAEPGVVAVDINLQPVTGGSGQSS